MAPRRWWIENLPHVADYRWWTLSFPRWLRIRLLCDKALVSEVLAMFERVVFAAAAHELDGRLARPIATERMIAALLVDRFGLQLFFERAVEVVAQVCDRCRVGLCDEIVAVFFDHETGQ